MYATTLLKPLSNVGKRNTTYTIYITTFVFEIRALD